MKQKETCQNCGKPINSYKVLIRNNVWGCRACSKDIESHGYVNRMATTKDCTNCIHYGGLDEYPGDPRFECIRTESIDKYWETTKIIRVNSCKNCPNVLQGSKWEYCHLNGSQNKLSLDYSIPVWCPLDDEVEE